MNHEYIVILYNKIYKNNDDDYYYYENKETQKLEITKLIEKIIKMNSIF
jgi:hypothetical protein